MGPACSDCTLSIEYRLAPIQGTYIQMLVSLCDHGCTSYIFLAKQRNCIKIIPIYCFNGDNVLMKTKTRKDMALSAISMNSALADKEFVLSLHHKLHMSTCINKPNDVHKHNQSIFHSINQSFLHKQQWNLPPWWNYLQVFIQRRSLIRQNRIRQILPFKLRPLTAHIRM